MRGGATYGLAPAFAMDNPTPIDRLYTGCCSPLIAPIPVGHSRRRRHNGVVALGW